jgi:penicillin-binding protein 2
MTQLNDGQSRDRVFYIGIAVVFVVFLFRLIELQILYKDVYGKKSEENSIRPLTKEPIRGYIFDRNGLLLVDNRPSYTVTVTPSEFPRSKTKILASILQVDSTFLMDRIKRGIFYNRFAPVKIKRDVDFATLSLIEENREELPGVDYQIETKRSYPTGAKAPHLFGYTKEITERQLGEHPDEYRPGDEIGATGIEAEYEKDLRGRKGIEFKTVNAKGQVMGSYNEGKSDVTGKEGDDLYLAIDEGVQALAESLLAGRSGAVVAIDPNDGGVIALASKPDYDPEALSGFTSAAVWNGLNDDPGKPLFNRATLTRYPPGSTFKMVLAAAALEGNIVDPDHRIFCNGSFFYGNRAFTDLHAHGSTDMVEAIQRSCNVYFWQTMLKTGLDRWNHYGEEFGFGTTTGIDITEEDHGLLPSKEYFDKTYGPRGWTTGFLLSLAIGQGEVGVSPLQMACYAATLGNRGHYHRPHVVRKIRDKASGQLLDVPVQTRELDISDKTWDLIQDGMYRCVNVPGGTGGQAKVSGVVVSGKTGTADNPHGKAHSWFIGFAPLDHPKIAVCVLVENAGFGGTIAAPIAGMCIEQYIYGRLVRKNKTLPTQSGELIN